jgi:hypothetical protein
MSQLGEGRQVGEQHGELHHAAFLDMGAAASANVGIARAAFDAERPVDRAQRAGQHRAADAALRRQLQT